MSGHASRRRLTAVFLAVFVVGSSVVGVAGVVDVAGGQASETRYVDTDEFLEPFCGPSGAREYESIQNAVNDSSPNDIIVVCDGRYEEAVTIDKPLIIKDQSTDADPAILDGDGDLSTAITITSSGQGTDIDGLDLVAYTSSGVSVENTSDIRLNATTFERFSGPGIEITNAADVTVTNTSYDRLSGPAVNVTNASGVTVADISVAVSSGGVAIDSASAVTVSTSSFQQISSPAINVTSASDVSVTDLTVADGPAGVAAENASTVTVERATFDGLSGTAVTLNSSTDVTVRSAEVTDGPGGVAASASEGITVENTTFDGLSGPAVELADTNGSSVRGGRLTSGSEGVLVRGSSGVTVNGTEFDGSSGPAVEIRNAPGATVEDVTVSDGSGGVVVRSSPNVEVLASTFDGTPGPAIDVGGTSGALVRDATVTDTPAGIVASSTPDIQVVGVQASEVDAPAVNLTNAPRATVENVDISNGSAGIRTTTSPNVTVADATVENVDETGIELVNTDGALVRDVTVTNAERGVDVTATGGEEVSNVTVLDATVSGAEDGVLARAAGRRATVAGFTLSGSTLTENDRGVGVLASGDSSRVTGVTLEDSTINDSAARAAEVSTVNSNVVIEDVVLRNLTVEGPGTGANEGIYIEARNAGVLRNITVRNSSITSHGVGVTLRDRAEVENVVVLRNRIEGTRLGVVLGGDGSRPLEGVAVRQNLVVDAGDAGVFVTGGTDAREIRVTRNVIRDNGVGIENDGGNTLTAWLNYWGSDSGPSDDQYDGDVRVDPWIGQGACSADGLDSVALGTADIGHTELNRSEFQSFCAWDRAPLALRPDPTDAAMDVANLNLSYDLPGTDRPVSADRRNVSIYQADEPIELRFDAGSTDASRFAGNETQLIVVRDRERTTPSFDVGFEDRPGETVLRSDADRVSEIEDWGTVNGNGRLNGSYTPPAPGSYTFVLVRPDFGPGLEDVAVSNETRIDGGATVLGFETVVVREAEAEATPTNANASYPVGSNVTLDVSSNLGDASTDHAVFLYDESRFRNATATVTVDATAADVVAGRFDPASDVTVESSIGSANGVVRSAVAFSALGTGVAAGEDSGGDVDPSPFLGLGTRLYDTSATDPTDAPGATPLNGSVVVVESGGSDTTVDVETLRNFSTGTYRYVYVAERGRFRNTSSTTGTVEITAPVATPTPTPDDGDGSSGGGGGGQPGGGADGEVQIQDSTLLNESVSAGRSVVVRVDLANFDPVRGTITLNLASDGTNVTERSVAVGASSERTVYLRVTFETPGTYSLALDGDPLGSVTVTAADTDTPTDTTAPTTPTASPGEEPEPTASPGDETSPSTGTQSPAAGSGPDGTAAPDGDVAAGVGPPPASGTDAIIALGMSLLLLYGVGVAVYVLREHPPPRL